MLPQEFIDWWFEPWAYATSASPLDALATGPVSRRDGYRLWCAQAGVDADLPSHFDPNWYVAASDDGSRFLRAARLFGGLIAARAQQHHLLSELAFEDRKWCVSIAATQPLLADDRAPFVDGDGIAEHGVYELARRLESGFPGMWTRLRLLIAPPLAARIDALLASMEETPQERSSVRAQRCWSLCEARAEQHDEAVDEHDAYDDALAA